MSDYQQQYQSYFDEIERYLQGLFMGGQPYDRLQIGRASCRERV